MPLETFPFDAAEHLNTAETIAWFIRETVASGDPEEIANSVGLVERARRMHGIGGGDGAGPSEASTLDRGEALHALLRMLNELGFELTLRAVEAEQPAEAA